MSHPQGSDQYPRRVETPRTNGFAVASLVLAVVAITTGVLPVVGIVLSFAPCVLAIVFGIFGLQRATGSPGRPGYSLALAGLIVAGLTFLLYFTGYGLIW
jgi:hypothetical protein